MNPKEFTGCNVVYAKDQPQYLQLPAYKDEDGTVITEWELSEEEKKKISAGENLRISILTFNQPLQPLRPYLASMTEQYEAEEKGRKSNAYTDRKVGDEPKIKQPLILQPSEVSTCECGKRFPSEFSISDTDGNESCPSCYRSMLEEKLDKAYKRINKLKNSGYPNENEIPTTPTPGGVLTFTLDRGPGEQDLIDTSMTNIKHELEAEAADMEEDDFPREYVVKIEKRYTQDDLDNMPDYNG